MGETGDAVVAHFDAGSGLPCEAAVLIGQVDAEQFGLVFLEPIAPKANTCVGLDVEDKVLLVDAVEFDMSHYAMARFIKIGHHRVVGERAVIPVVDFPWVKGIGAAYTDVWVEKVGVGTAKCPNFVNPIGEIHFWEETFAAYGKKSVAEADFVATEVLCLLLFLCQGWQT